MDSSSLQLNILDIYFSIVSICMEESPVIKNIYR